RVHNVYKPSYDRALQSIPTRRSSDHLKLTPRSHRPRAAGHRSHGRLDELANTEGLQNIQQRLQLGRGARRLDNQRVRADVHNVGTEELRSLDNLGAVAISGSDLDQQQTALHRGLRIRTRQLEHRNQLVQLLRNLLDNSLLALDDEGDAIDAVDLGAPRTNGDDIERTPGEHPGDAGDDSVLVLSQDRQSVKVGH